MILLAVGSSSVNKFGKSVNTEAGKEENLALIRILFDGVHGYLLYSPLSTTT